MRKNIVLLFPGQGSQYVGMDLIAQEILGYDYVQNIWNEINTKLGFNLQKIVHDGPIHQLTLTQHAQPSLVVTSCLMLEVFYKVYNSINAENFYISNVLGHSLGEYSALVAAGSLKLVDAAHITFLRGKFMQEAVAPGKGAMVAILKCPIELISKACAQASESDSKASIANLNSTDQVVISGHKEAVDRAINWLEKNVTDRLRAIELQVSAPFHSELMKPAELSLAPFLDTLEMCPNKISYVSNIDGVINPAETPTHLIKNKLKKQICATVEWVKSIQNFSSETLFIEVGAGSVLSGLSKKIIPSCKIYNMDTQGSDIGLKDFLLNG